MAITTANDTRLTLRRISSEQVTRLARRLAAPEQLFLWLGFIVGWLFLIVTPPFQAPDETQHFFRSYQLAKGQIIAEKREAHTGGEVAVSVHDVVAALVRDVPHNTHIKVPIEDIRAALTVPLEREHEGFVDFRTVALYTPVAHLPQALGMALGRALDQPALLLLYIGRVFAMTAAVALTALAIRLTPIFKWWFFIFAFLPMTTFLRSSLSADTMVISLALLFLALCLRFAFISRPRTSGTLALLIAAIALSLAKQSYFLLPLLFLLIPIRRYGTRARYALVLGAILGLSLLLIGLWTAIAQGLYTPSEPYSPDPTQPVTVVFDPRAQVGVVLADPLRLLRAIGQDVRDRGVVYTSQFVGVLGWLDTRLPRWLQIAYGAALISVALLDGNRRITLSHRQRLTLAGVGTASALLVITIGYVMWNRVGSSDIWGIQGRYFIPIAPALFLLLHNRRLRLNGALKAALVVFCVASSLVTLDVLLDRYYGL